MSMFRHLAWMGMATILMLATVSLQAADELLAAIKANDVVKLKAMIEADPKLLGQELPYYDYPLNIAVMGLHLESVRFFLEKGADVNASNEKRGQGPLHLLAQQEAGLYPTRFEDMKTIFLLLIEKKADLKKFDRKGRTPLYALAETQQSATSLPQKLEFMKLMIEKGASTKVMQDKLTRPIIVTMLTDPYLGQLTELPEATRLVIRRNAFETIKLLLENGLDPNASDSARNNSTPLLLVMKAVKESLPVASKEEWLKLLIDHGADKNKKNDLGEKPERLLDGRDDPLTPVLKKYRPEKKKKK